MSIAVENIASTAGDHFRLRPIFVFLLTFSALLHASSDIPDLSAKLVTTTSGWAIYRHHLFWTKNVGKSWRDITPPLETGESISSTFFLNSSVGWVSIFHETADAKSTFVLATTLDSGQTWQKSIVGPASPYLSSVQQIWAGASYIFFSDAMNGWAELQRASSSNFKDGILLATRDGGKSWIELPQPPTVDAMTWISPDVGWIVGGLQPYTLFSNLTLSPGTYFLSILAVNASGYVGEPSWVLITPGSASKPVVTTAPGVSFNGTEVALFLNAPDPPASTFTPNFQFNPFFEVTTNQNSSAPEPMTFWLLANSAFGLTLLGRIGGPRRKGLTA